MKIFITALLAPLTFAAPLLTAAQAQSLSPEQQELAAENFKQADADQDGVLAKDEFQVFMQANAEDKLGSAEMVVRNSAYAQAFGKLDKNGDGQIAAEELGQSSGQAAGQQQGEDASGDEKASQPVDQSAPSQPSEKSSSASPPESDSALAQENFSAADADESGGLSQEEFKVFMRANAQDQLGSSEKVVQNNAYGQAFSKIDGDRDGQITMDEFAAAAAGQSTGSGGAEAADRLPKGFQTADADNSGGLTLGEFRAFLRATSGADASAPPKIRMRASLRAFQRLDRNGDGQITPVELSQR